MTAPAAERAPELRPGWTRLGLALAMAVPIGTLALRQSSDWPGTALLSLALVAGGLTRGRLRASPLAGLALQVLAGALPLGLLILLDSGSGVTGRAGVYIALGALGPAGLRLTLPGSRRGHAVTLGLILLGWMGLSRGGSPLAFGLGTLAVSCAGLAALLACDPAFAARPRVLARGLLLPAALTALGGGVLGASLALAIQSAEGAVSAALLPYLLDQGGRARSGFDGGDVRLGELTEVGLSNEVLLRIWGPRTDYLRGQVYSTYEGGRWRAAQRRRGARARPDAGDPLVLGRGPERGRLRIEGQPGAGRHLFAPLDALRVLHAPPETALDGRGVLRLPASLDQDLRRYEVVLGDAAVHRDLDGPEPEDLEVPEELRPRLQTLAAAWGASAGPPAQRAAALRAHLQQDYRYGLRFPPSPRGQDPVWTFLEQSRVGHCEFFAAALALLARSQGIPARFVGGFRVIEENPLGGYHLARARDAHAWVELWLDDRWQTADATPPGALPSEAATTLPWWRGLQDLLQRALGLAWERMSNLAASEIVLALCATALLLLAWAWLRRRRGPSGPARRHGWPPLAALEQGLRRRGLPRRGAAETLARYAARLRERDEGEAAALLSACAALLYGGHGDEERLRQDIARWLRGGPPSRPDPAGSSTHVP